MTGINPMLSVIHLMLYIKYKWIKYSNKRSRLAKWIVLNDLI